MQYVITKFGWVLLLSPERVGIAWPWDICWKIAAYVMSFLQLCFLGKNIWKASRCPGFLVIILEACNLQILKGEEMAISSWADSLLYATSYLLFKALLSTGMTGESRLGESRIFCMAGTGAFKIPHFPPPRPRVNQQFLQNFLVIELAPS